MTDLTLSRLNRSTLRRQLLSARVDLGVDAAVEAVVALQAQEPAAPYVALWNRIEALDFEAVDRAFDEHSLVKASLMRITLHAVSARDYTAFHEASLPLLRAARLNDRRYRETGLTAAEADGVMTALLDFVAEPRRKHDIVAHVAAVPGGSAEPRLWWALRTFAPIMHAPTGATWSFGSDMAYQAAPSAPDRPATERAVDMLVRRYLAGFGPATIADFAQFSMQKMSVARPAFGRLADELVVRPGPGRADYYDLADALPVPDADEPAPPRLMSMWDSTLLAYKDRSRLIPERWRPHVIRRNGDVLPTVLVDGFVAGVWRPVEAGVEVTAFDRFDHTVWDQLAGEAAALTAAIGDRRPLPFQRFVRWWKTLPVREQRVLI